MLQSNKPNNKPDNKPIFKPSIKDMDLDDLQSKIEGEDEKIRLTNEECESIINYHYNSISESD
jgi:hypothetical protein